MAELNVRAGRIPTEKDCLDLANRLIGYCKYSSASVCCIKDISSDFLTTLFEDITGRSVPDQLCPMSSVEEAYNIEALINTLSLDILGISLSHITGDAIVAGGPTAIFNLLEVIEGILLHLPNEDRATELEKNSTLMHKRKRNHSEHEMIPSFHSTRDKREKTCQMMNSSSSSEAVQSHLSSMQGINKEMKPAKFGVETPTISKFGSNHFWFTNASTTGKIASSSDPYAMSSSTLISSKVSSNRKPTENKSSAHWNQVHLSKHAVENCGTYSSMREKPVKSFISSKKVIKAVRTPLQIDKSDESWKNIPVKGIATTSDVPVIKRKVSKLKQTKEIKEPSQEIETLFEKNLERKLKSLLESNYSPRCRSSQMKKVYLQAMEKPVLRKPLSACNKSYLLPHNLRRRPLSRTSPKRLGFYKNQSSDILRKRKETSIQTVTSGGLLQELLGEFPGIRLPSSVLSLITKKYENHLMNMHKQLKQCLLKKPITQSQAEEIAKRQSTLTGILEKESDQQKYLKQVKEKRKYQNKINYRLRDARLQSAKMKQYCNEFQDMMRKKMQKRNFSEELIVQNALKEALNMQKEQVLNLCKQKKETEQQDAKHQMVYLDALENLYKTQFSLLAESLVTEDQDMKERYKAQKRAVSVMQREFQENLKHEVRELQKTIVELMQDTHFRELDAEQYQRKLRDRFS